jgi:[ribosomal protein S5]-alanine N-acetyltransferase
MTEILTERVRLRPLTPDDLDALHATVFGDPEVSWTRTARSYEDGRESLDAKIAAYRERGFGMLAVEDRETGEVLGYAGLQHLEDGPEVEVGYYLGRKAWGRGLATEIARRVVEYGFTELELPRIVAVVRPDNAASQNVLSKAGLRKVGTGHHYDADVEVWAVGRPGS